MKRMFFAVAAITACSHISAQQKKDSVTATEGKTLDPVVVSATKYPIKTSLTGKVLTVITADQLAKSGGKDLSQILTEQAGMYLNGSNSNPGKDKSIYLRGARIDHTLITVDGVPVYDPSGIGGNFDIRNLSISSIERIEILKGSQSTLYGSDAIAGVINIITKKASSKKIAGDAMLAYGSFNTVKGNAGISGTDNKISYYANYSIHTTKGINEAASSIAGADKDGYTQHSMQAGFSIKATDHIRIQPYVRYTKINGDLDQGAFTDELDFTYLQKSMQAGVRNEITWGKSKVNLLYSYNHINRLYVDDSLKSRNGFDTYSKGTYKGHEHFADIYFCVPVTGMLKVTAGADFRSSASDQEYYSVGFFGPYTSKYSSDSLHQRQLGLYASLNLQTKSGFSIEAGNRINVHSSYGSHYVFNINPSMLITERVKLFANLSSAYRTPSLYQLFSEYGNSKLKPEAALTFEGGLQYYAPGNKLNARAVYFRRNVNDVIFFFFNPSTYQSQYINQDKQKDHGVELELSATVAKNTTVKAFYTFVTGNISTKTAAAKDTTYFNLLRRPKSSVGINLGSQLTKQLYVSTNLAGFGERQDAYFDPQTYATVQTTLKPYWLWDVYVQYALLNNRLNVFVDLRNITGTKFTEVSGFNTVGFAAYCGVRCSF